jgi:hypothetical protein
VVRALLFLVLLLTGCGIDVSTEVSGSTDESPELPEATTTHSLVVGTLKWPNDVIAPFDPTDRRDLALHEYLVNERGVPADNASLLLDQAATRENILAGLADIALRAKAGDLAFVYFTGHGLRAEDGAIYFSNYDLVPDDFEATGFAIDDVADALSELAPGVRLILLGDFCHSGALTQVAEKLSATSLTSAEASNLSTGNWTFTQTMLRVLKGDSLADRNHDGAIDLSEAKREIDDAMKYTEWQRAGSYLPQPELVLGARAPGPDFGVEADAVPGFPAGTYAWLYDYTSVRVRTIEGEAVIADHVKYASIDQVPLAPDSLYPVELTVYEVGSPVEVWDMDFATLYPAVVLEVSDDFHYVTYPGYGSIYDEWVLSDRIQGLAH